MILADTSVIVADLRDGGGRLWSEMESRFPGRERVIAAPTALEILIGARNAAHWKTLRAHLDLWTWADIRAEDWAEAARIFCDLRRRGVTPRSLIDCCIAQAAIARGATLLHCDRDFERIAEIRPLLQERLN